MLLCQFTEIISSEYHQIPAIVAAVDHPAHQLFRNRWCAIRLKDTISHIRLSMSGFSQSFVRFCLRPAHFKAPIQRQHALSNMGTKIRWYVELLEPLAL